jgi:hypothetical protein
MGLFIVGVVGALVFAFVKMNALEERIESANRGTTADVKQLYAVADQKQRAIDGLQTGLSESARREAELRKDLTQVQTDFAAMKATVTSAARDAMTKEIVESATNQAVAKAIPDLEVAHATEFVEGVAKSLATRHQAELRGPRGLDADEQKVASFLVTQPEFLDAVSTSILELQKQQQDK